MADESKYHEFIKRVSEEIAELKKTCPQLKDFSIDKHADIENLKVIASRPTSLNVLVDGYLVSQTLTQMGFGCILTCMIRIQPHRYIRNH